MNQPEPFLLNLRQPGASDQLLFARPPILTSHSAGWNSLHLEYHNQPEHDTPEHYLADHALVIKLGQPLLNTRMLDGRVQQEFQSLGSIAVMPAGVLHRAAGQNTGEFVVLTLDPTFFNTVAQEWTDPDQTQLVPHFATQKDPLILQMCLTLKQELESDCPGGRLYGDAIAQLLAVHLLRHYCTQSIQVPVQLSGLSHRSLQDILDYIHTHLDENLSLETLATLARLSPHYFCRQFKQSIGMTPHQYLIKQRIERAKQLLKHPELVISDIAVQCGFANQSHLHKHFRHLTGMTPKAYRQAS